MRYNLGRSRQPGAGLLGGLDEGQCPMAVARKSRVCALQFRPLVAESQPRRCELDDYVLGSNPHDGCYLSNGVPFDLNVPQHCAVDPRQGTKYLARLRKMNLWRQLGRYDYSPLNMIAGNRAF